MNNSSWKKINLQNLYFVHNEFNIVPLVLFQGNAFSFSLDLCDILMKETYCYGLVLVF